MNNAVWVQWIQKVAVAHWEAVAGRAHKDAYYWVVIRHEIDYLRAALEGDADYRSDLGRRSPSGARFHAPSSSSRKRRKGLRPGGGPSGR